jgi:alpha-tubulin suppressor-like RCC1 family protein
MHGRLRKISLAFLTLVLFGSVTGLFALPAGAVDEAPIVTIATDNAPDGDAGWFRTSPVTGTVTADDTTTGGSDITSIDCNIAVVPSGIGTPVATATFSISAEGITHISCTATDATSSTSAPTELDVMLDSNRPVGSVVINDGADMTANPSATLDLSATDAVGVTAYRFANGANCAAATWVPVASTTALNTSASITLPAGSGPKNVCAVFKDAAGNLSLNYVDTILLVELLKTVAGWLHSCARMSNGTARCWGNNASGQLGDGTTTNRSLPVIVKNSAGTGPLTGVSDIEVGLLHTCARIGSGGSMKCWGNNSSGQLGDGTTTNRLLPVNVVHPDGTDLLQGVTQMSLSGVYSCAREADATVLCWGGNGSGNLGDGTTINRLLPVAVKNAAGTASLQGVTQISARGPHTCARLKYATALCWGNNVDGMLGDATTTNRRLPVTVMNAAGTAALTGVAQISAGTNHTCTRMGDGTARCWGNNARGQLGDNTVTRRLLPVTVMNAPGTAALTGVAQISAGTNYTCTRMGDGTARCWGLNSGGQLGDGTTTERHRPVAVRNPAGTAALTGTSAISARDTHTCARLTNATAVCWGNNNSGKLGDGTTTNRPLPVVVQVP